MKTRGIRASLAALAAIPLGLMVLVVWSWARGVVAPLPSPPPSRRLAGGLAGDSVPAMNLGAFVAHDPFRAGRAPARVAYDPVVLAAGPPPPAPPKPVLTLTGIGWGAEPEAVIE